MEKQPAVISPESVRKPMLLRCRTSLVIARNSGGSGLYFENALIRPTPCQCACQILPFYPFVSMILSPCSGPGPAENAQCVLEGHLSRSEERRVGKEGT